MNKDTIKMVQEGLAEIAILMAKEEDPAQFCYAYFSHDPGLVIEIIDVFSSLDEEKTETLESESLYYAACVFAFDVCLGQLKTFSEGGNKLAKKTLSQLMIHLAKKLQSSGHHLSYWLPILNAFYDVRLELSPELTQAYFDLIDHDETAHSENEVTHLNSIRDLIHELSDLSDFDIAENFFAQSYAMHTDFFIDLMIDLFSMEEGQDIGLLALLHPRADVRFVVVDALDELLPNVTLSSVSLSRLQAIKAWYPDYVQEAIHYWIREQRKKEVIFQQENPAQIECIYATEVDGSGAQGMFIHFKRGRRHRLCGLLVKTGGIGIKDAWLTPYMTREEAVHYYAQVFEDTVVLREVDLDYLIQITNHFLAMTIEQGNMPDLHLLEIQEELGIHFSPKPINQADLMAHLSIEIVPFTSDVVATSLKRSKSWVRNKRYTESWYIEDEHIDKLVNRYCTFVEGVKVCNLHKAIADVLEALEAHREQWLFHFLWVALWLKSKKKANEIAWQDSFLIAHEIESGRPLLEIPIMKEICQHSVINSVETMQDRKTYLTQE